MCQCWLETRDKRNYTDNTRNKLILLVVLLPMPVNRNPNHVSSLIRTSSGGWIRTTGSQVMSLVPYLLATPQRIYNSCRKQSFAAPVFVNLIGPCQRHLHWPCHLNVPNLTAYASCAGYSGITYPVQLVYSMIPQSRH